MTERAKGAVTKTAKHPLRLNLLWWLWMPTLLFLYWGWINLPLHLGPRGIGSFHQDLHLFLQRHVTASDGGVWGLATEFWVWLAIGLLGTMVITAWRGDSKNSKHLWTVVISGVLSLLLIVMPVTKGIWNAVYDEANWYLRSSPVYVENPKLNGAHPSSLGLLYSQKLDANWPDSTGKKVESPDGKTVTIGHTTVKQGGFPVGLVNFEPRAAAYDGALKALQQKTQAGNKEGIWDQTVTYVYGAPLGADETKQQPADATAVHPQINRWSAVVDVAKEGDGNYANPTAGVAEWVGGMNVTHVCRFGGEHNENNKFNRAFGGQHMNSLRNVLYGKYKNLVWEDRDVSGYCDKDDHPVIIIAVTCNVGVKDSKGRVVGSVIVPAPCGILKLTGSPSGDPNIQYIPDVEAGQYPVPVYPTSVVDTQLDMTKMWAGRGNNENSNFGYQKSDYESQAGNDGGYIMRNAQTGAIYSLTPQKAKSSGKSQLYVNWAFVRVDSVHSGKLNELSSYVLNDNDPHATDTVTLYNTALNAVNSSTLQVAQNFLGNKNVLVEFIPIGENRFRGYGQNPTGNTILYVDVSIPNGPNAKPAVITAIDGLGTPARSETIQVDANGNAQNPGGQNNGGNQQPGATQPGNTGNAPGTCNGKPLAQASLDELTTCAQSGRAAEDELIARLRRSQASTAPSSPVPSPSK